MNKAKYIKLLTEVKDDDLFNLKPTAVSRFLDIVWSILMDWLEDEEKEKPQTS